MYFYICVWFKNLYLFGILDVFGCVFVCFVVATVSESVFALFLFVTVSCCFPSNLVGFCILNGVLCCFGLDGRCGAWWDLVFLV